MVQTTGNGGEAVAGESVASRLSFGVLGAVVGACIGSGLMRSFMSVTNFRFPLLGTGIGVLCGLAARWLNKGGDDRLGFVAGTLSLAAVGAYLVPDVRHVPLSQRHFGRCKR